ncbi:MAG: carboxypeptidase regulatory-like domain-containing protein [Thermoplasmatales archaeon]|nr:carboxypeptidase regulatory-like domain-containing protein [Thermoplasmatales archaeon]
MQIRKLLLAYIIIILIISPVVTINVNSEESSLPVWNSGWSYRQEITLPISTEKAGAKFQPIDIHTEFTRSCWGKNENEHSIRVCCWDGIRWHELESQIYDLEFKDINHISKCGIVFLVPEFANGEERYSIYYDGNEKFSPGYKDHLNIEDAYYYYEPISGIIFEVDYYQIEEDGFMVYAIGQKGKIINRALSQGVVKMKPGTKTFDLANSDNLVALSFAYNIGVNDEDQVASDQKLISKDIHIDGNLMIEFGIVSESNDKELRTTNIYKYYYCPTEKKRICVNVKHEVLKKGIVKGQENLDGAYGGLVAFRSRSAMNKRMRFGEILPYLHVYGENNQIKEYNLNPNPESKERQWTIPYTDDCDLGENAWISYDEGESGKAVGLLFSSNKNIVKYGKDERDGIQIKSGEKEYLDVLGTEIDYLGVMFGRNSYEKGSSHDLDIPDDLVVEYHVELFTTDEGGYKEIISEQDYFKDLWKYRQSNEGESDGGDKNIYTLTVIPHLVNLFYFPVIANLTGFTISETWGELYKDGEFISKASITKPLLGPPKIKFPKLEAGEYIVKIYRKFGKLEKRIIAMEKVNINRDRVIFPLCTTQKTIYISVKDQEGKRIKDIDLSLFRNETLFIKNQTIDEKDIIMKVNLDLSRPYTLKAKYKGFIVYNKKISILEKRIDIQLDIYDLTINVKDKLGFNPGVDVRPYLISDEMDEPIELSPDDVTDGSYTFEKLLPARYKLYISYGRFSDTKFIDLSKNGESADIEFSAIFDLKTKLFDSRGNQIRDSDLKLDIKREGEILFEKISPDEDVNIPPGKYTVKVYSDDKIVGIKNVELTNDKNVNIVTNLKSIMPTLVTWVILIFIIEIIVIFLFRRFTLNTFLKLLAIALVVLSLFQPWWALNSQSDDPIAEKSSEMFILPQTMMESVTYNGKTERELATLPEMFTDFVETLLFIIYTGIFLMCFSFIPNLLLKRRYFIVLISASTVFLILVSLAFSIGMSKIAELSLGSLNGEGSLGVMLNNGDTVFMESTWGLSTGFYLCIFSAGLLIATGFIDLLRKKKWPGFLFKKE